MKVLAKNRRASYDYQIKDHLIAGLSLKGWEVKSAKLGQVSLKGSFISLRQGEAWLTNSYFTPYAGARRAETQADRSRKLLLHRRQLDELNERKRSGLSVVPVTLFEERGLVKLNIGIGRGKKRYDKREDIKRREHQRQLNRSLKSA